MPDLADLRIEPFTGADETVAIRDECHTVPASGKYYIYLNEYPSQCPGCTITVRPSEPAVSLPCDRDATIYEATPTLNYGVSGAGVHNVRTGADINTPLQHYRGMFGFDLTSGPSEALLATLYLRLAYTPAAGQFADDRSIGVHRVGGDWAEGTVTWANQPYHDPVASAVTLIDGTPLADDWKTFNITRLYNQWASGEHDNHGIKLIDGNPTDQDIQRDWRSREYSGGSFAPYIEVKSLLPELTQVAYPPGAGQYSINWDRGVLAFHASLAGEEVCVSYCGRGSNITAQLLNSIM